MLSQAETVMFSSTPLARHQGNQKEQLKALIHSALKQPQYIWHMCMALNPIWTKIKIHFGIKYECMSTHPLSVGHLVHQGQQPGQVWACGLSMMKKDPGGRRSGSWWFFPQEWWIGGFKVRHWQRRECQMSGLLFICSDDDDDGDDVESTESTKTKLIHKHNAKGETFLSASMDYGQRSSSAVYNGQKYQRGRK